MSVTSMFKGKGACKKKLFCRKQKNCLLKETGGDDKFPEAPSGPRHSQITPLSGPLKVAVS